MLVYLHEGRTLSVLACGTRGNALCFQDDYVGRAPKDAAGRVTILFEHEDWHVARRALALLAATTHSFARSAVQWQSGGQVWEVLETGQLWDWRHLRYRGRSLAYRRPYTPPVDVAPPPEIGEPLEVLEDVPAQERYLVWREADGSIGLGRNWQGVGVPTRQILSGHMSLREAHVRAHALGMPRPPGATRDHWGRKLYARTGKRRGRPAMAVRCIETGEEFATQHEAAQACRVSQALVSKSARGLLEEPIKGLYTFEKVEQ